MGDLLYSADFECTLDDKDLLIAELWERGCRGITELSDSFLRAFFDEIPDSFRDADWEPVEEQDWIAYARTMLEPMLVGERFFLVPEWRDDPAPPGRFRIVVNPGMAFGTGFHETTQLCIEALERRVKPGMSVLDVGTGSGILAEAARLLGAGRVIGCDIDREAVEIAGLRIPAFLGSADAVASSSAELVVANITPGALVKLTPDILRVLRPGGVALLSGFEVEDAPFAGLPLYTKGDWGLLEYFGDRHDGDVLRP